MSIIQVVQPKFIHYDSNYWAMHFVAILNCLHDHKLLEFRPEKILSRAGENWSLSDFRGHAPREAFLMMIKYLQNWGAQYLIADAINKNLLQGQEELFEALRRVHPGGLENVDEVLCYVSGKDSRAGTCFLTECDARILGDRRRRVNNSIKHVAFADLCLLFSNEWTGKRVAVFGEVEGNRGHRLRSPDYWVSKSPYAQFGIGCFPKVESGFVQTIETGVGKKVILGIDADQSILSDFCEAIDAMDALIERGPTDRRISYYQKEGLKNIIQTLAFQWDVPIWQVIKSLQEKENVCIYQSDIPTFPFLDLPLHFMIPKIIQN